MTLTTKRPRNVEASGGMAIGGTPMTARESNPRPLKCECGTCKTCKNREYQRRFQERHPERRREQYRRAYEKRGGPAYDAEWRRRNDSWRESVKNWKTRNPEKERASKTVTNAVRDGRLKRGLCENCGEPKADGHHDDYTKPLEVRWLCRRCHKAHHAAVQDTEVSEADA